MSSVPLELGINSTTSEQNKSEASVPEIADLSITEEAPPSPSSNFFQHFSHDHPLILFELEGEVRVGLTLIGCSACRDDPILDDDGPIYCCIYTGCDQKFFLHKSCAELPMIMVSVFHLPAHPLNLSPSSYHDCSTCDRCRQDIHGFRYRCAACNVDLHIRCALPPKYEPKSHDGQDHSFILFKPTTFTCDVCGFKERSKMISYLCTICQIQVHANKKCSSSSYPLKLKNIRHDDHELTLTCSFQLDYSDYHHMSCKICNKRLNRVFYVYYCSPCDYITHVSCATSEELIRDEQVGQHLSNFIQPGPPVETSDRVGGEGEDQKQQHHQLQQQQQQLSNHVSHPHCLLILSNEQPNKIDERCDGCALPISVPFYSCAGQCNFSLHKQCAELSGKIKHPLHRHPLTLKAKYPNNYFGLFQCKGCDVVCNGFAYICDKCYSFYLCVRCSLHLGTLSHEGHQCPKLNLLYEDETRCSACGLKCPAKFKCERCDFFIDFRCASLPKAIMHKCPKPDWGIRPLELTYSSVEDESGEYYCDICEEHRGQNHWFYYCEACDYSCHPQCILGKYMVKFGRTYELSIHPHPLTCVEKVKGGPTCATCKKSCKGSPVLVCAECDIYFHFSYNCTD